MSQNKKILIITPFLNAGGSEYIIRKLALFLIKREYEVYMYSYFHALANSELEEAGVKFSCAKKKNILIRIFEKIFNYKSEIKELKKIQSKFNADIWYVNTIILPQVIKVASTLNVKTIMHLHESLMAIDSYLVNQEFEATLKLTDTIISVSKRTTDLFLNSGFPKEKIFTIPPFLHIDKDFEIDVDRIKTLRKEMNIPTDAFIIGMSGAANFTKGFDRVVQICELIKPLNGHFIWIGNPSNSSSYSITMNTLKHKSINNFHFLGAKNHPEYYDFLNMIDVFTLTSRSDTFPLVMIEAAYFKIPIVAFDDTGADEFVTAEIGHLVRNGDVKSMIELVKIEVASAGVTGIRDESYINSFTNSQSLEKIENVIFETIFYDKN